MLGLPEVGDKVKIWPAPGRKAHVNARPVDTMGGGRFLKDEGEEVLWSEFHLTQLKAGDVMMHSPLSE